jgi:hypothetical protein
MATREADQGGATPSSTTKGRSNPAGEDGGGTAAGSGSRFLPAALVALFDIIILIGALLVVPRQKCRVFSKRMSRRLLIFSERRLRCVTSGDALCTRLLGRLESSEDSDRLLDVAPSLDSTAFFSASTIAALTQRTTIEPLCQRFTFFEYQAIPLLRFSIAFVVRSFTYRRPSTPSLPAAA